jgi:hypothetical protein
MKLREQSVTFSGRFWAGVVDGAARIAALSVADLISPAGEEGVGRGDLEAGESSSPVHADEFWAEVLHRGGRMASLRVGEVSAVEGDRVLPSVPSIARTGSSGQHTEQAELPEEGRPAAAVEMRAAQSEEQSREDLVALVAPDQKGFLGPGERVTYASRRHIIVLSRAAGACLGMLAVGWGAGLASRWDPRIYLGQVGVGLALVGTLAFAVRVWQWWETCYVFTNERVLLIEGILSRQVNGLSLREVNDTTYRRGFAGRLFGYGDLELNISGNQGLRKLTSLPRPGEIYNRILSLISSQKQLNSADTATELGEDQPDAAQETERQRGYRRVPRVP